jgi:hypothetical protein
LCLPIEAWLREAPSGARGVQMLPLDCLAAGAARICTQAERLAEAFQRQEAGLVCPVCGHFSRAAATMDCTNCGRQALPLWHQPPQLAANAPAAAPSRAYLTLVEPNRDARRTPIAARSFRIGRHPRADLRFADDLHPMVSSAHALIVAEGAEFRLEDLGSANGTYVNGSAVKCHSLRHNDEIRLGRNGPRLRFELEPPR